MAVQSNFTIVKVRKIVKQGTKTGKEKKNAEIMFCLIWPLSDAI